MRGNKRITYLCSPLPLPPAPSPCCLPRLCVATVASAVVSLVERRRLQNVLKWDRERDVEINSEIEQERETEREREGEREGELEREGEADTAAEI